MTASTEPAAGQAWIRRLRWILPLGFALLYVAPLCVRTLWVPDEVRYAEISREMVESGDWVVPRLLGLRYFEKPIGGYWLNSLSVSVFGANGFAVRLPSALATGISALILALLARSGTRDPRKAWCAALVYLSSFMLFAMGTYAVLDGMLTMWLTASFAAFWCAFRATDAGGRLRWWALFGVACGGAFLTKGFVALAIPFVAFVPFMLWQRRVRELVVYGALAVVTAGLTALPWSLAIHRRESDYWNFFFFHEHIKRFSGDDAQHAQPLWFYVPVVLGMSLPWAAFLWRALRSGWPRDGRRGDPFPTFLLLSAAMPFLLFSLAKGKLATYVLPCFGPLAILIASVVVDALDRGRTAELKRATWLNLALGAVIFVGAIGVALFSPDNEYVLSNPHAPWGLALVLLSWFGLCAAVLRGKIPFAPGNAALVVCLLPFLVLDPSADAAPMPTLRRVAREAEPDVVLACASVRLSPALALAFERTDIAIVGGVAELRYGIEYPEAAHRRVLREDLEAWLAAARAEHPVLLIANGDPETTVSRYPEPDRAEADGKLNMLFYDRR